MDLTEFDDPLLQDSYGDGFLELPKNKTARDVAEDYLRELYKFTICTLEKQLSPEIFRTMPMDVWVTTPAIWDFKAQNLTKEAAMAAGFGSRPGDTVNVITEPEAAALTVLKPHLGPGAIDPVQVRPPQLLPHLCHSLLTMAAGREHPHMRLRRWHCGEC